MKAITVTRFPTPAFLFLALSVINIVPAVEASSMPPAIQHSESSHGAESPESQLPDYYPAAFQNKGAIQRVEGGETLIINDVRYRLSPNVHIHTLDREFSPRETLVSGLEIAFTVGSISQRGRTIAEIWVLPAGTVEPH